MAEAKQMMVGNQLVTFKDEIARNSIQTILEDVANVISQLQSLTTEIANITISNNNQNEAINDIDRGVEGMKSNIAKNTTTIAELVESVQEAQSLVDTMNSDVAKMKTNVASYDSKIAGKIDKTQITSSLTESDETKVASAKAISDLYQQMDASGVAVVDSLDSTSTTSPLAANQGRVLNESIQLLGDDTMAHNEAIQTMQTAITAIDGDVDVLKAKITYGEVLPESLEEGKIFLLLKG